jgi:4-amino-4-deoxy-L-arabinose transferase-like glycosyltransferase
VHRFLGSEAAPAIFVGQVLLAVGAWYIYAILRLVTGLECAALFAFLYATSLYVLFAPLSYALNADILQLTSWPAILYHFLLGVRCDRRRHWLAFGIWSAAAVLTKYSSVVLFAAMAVAVFAVPEFRRVLKRPRLLIGVLVGIALVLPHATALDHDNAVKHAWYKFDASRPVAQRLQGLGHLLEGYLKYLAPGWIIVAAGWWKGTFAFGFPSGEEPGGTWLAALRFLIVLNVAIQVVLVLLIIKSVTTRRMPRLPYWLLVRSSRRSATGSRLNVVRLSVW